MTKSICDAIEMFKRIRAQREDVAPESEPPLVASKPEAPTIAPPTLEDVAGPGFRVIPPTPDLPKLVGNYWVQYTEVRLPATPYFWRGNAARTWWAISVYNVSIVLSPNIEFNGNSSGIQLWSNIELQRFTIEDWGTIVTQDWYIHCGGVSSFTIIEGIKL